MYVEKNEEETISVSGRRFFSFYG